ncbi:MAG: hypothetical protein KH443_13720, partial [Oscillospiraceae bacterium]|nr:hypothetical protein [Oscillospiraceae bacterium]
EHSGAVVHWPRPRGRFGYFAAMGKVTRRPQAAKSPARKSPPPSFALKKTGKHGILQKPI